MIAQILIFLSFLFYLFNLNANDKPFITSWLQSGQLGNQLHEIATCLAYAWDNHAEAIFPRLNHSDLNLSVNRDRLFFRLNSGHLPRYIRYSFYQFQTYEKVNIPVKPDQMLYGYFQTWEYYHHHRDKLLNIFSPKEEELNQIKEKHKALLNHPYTVAIHVRTFNKKWSSIIPFVGLDYYERALNYFPENALFVIFSDRINWCKHHFKKFNRPMIFIEGQDHIQDFILMSLLKHQIIANSSFSWWTAYLNTNPDKIVIAPNHFVHPSKKAKTNALLPEWIVLPIDYNYKKAPYPKDIAQYDLRSQSIDTQ